MAENTENNNLLPSADELARLLPPPYAEEQKAEAKKDAPPSYEEAVKTPQTSTERAYNEYKERTFAERFWNKNLGEKYPSELEKKSDSAPAEKKSIWQRFKAVVPLERRSKKGSADLQVQRTATRAAIIAAPIWLGGAIAATVVCPPAGAAIFVAGAFLGGVGLMLNRFSRYTARRDWNTIGWYDDIHVAAMASGLETNHEAARSSRETLKDAVNAMPSYIPVHLGGGMHPGMYGAGGMYPGGMWGGNGGWTHLGPGAGSAPVVPPGYRVEHPDISTTKTKDSSKIILMPNEGPEQRAGRLGPFPFAPSMPDRPNVSTVFHPPYDKARPQMDPSSRNAAIAYANQSIDPRRRPVSKGERMHAPPIQGY